MTIETPLYGPGDQAYLKESAAIGHLEPVVISGVTRGQGEWLYSIRAGTAQPSSAAHYGDRRSFVNAQTIFFTESELITLCDALALAEANMQRALDNIQAQRAAHCPSTES